MSLFKKAEPKASKLKVYVFGEAGTGKTRTALHFPSPAVVDAEGGTLHYGGEFDFHRIETSNPNEVHEAIDELLESPGDFKTFVIDPMTLIYDEIIRNKEQKMKEITGDPDYEIQPLDYKSIKTEVKILMNKLLSLDMNVIVTARSKPEYAKGKFMERIGSRPEGHKDLPYMFDVILELYIAEDGKRMAHVEKDRTNKLPSTFEFNYDAFVTYIGLDALERKADVSAQSAELSRRNSRSHKVTHNGREIFTAGIDAETLGDLEVLLKDYEEEAIRETLKEQYEVESLLDLSKVAGRTLLRALEQRQPDNQETEEQEN